MPRPYRPNTNPNAPRSNRLLTHVKQETYPEKRVRLREEAEERQILFEENREEQRLRRELDQ